MAKVHWYFLGGMLSVILPLTAIMLAKEFDLLEIRPDDKIVYKNVQGQDFYLDFFKPRTNQFGSPGPAILLFHGGRWQYGSGKDFYPQCKFFADNGLSCFVAQYRLGSGGIVDVRGAVEDATDALGYLDKHSKILGIDAERVVTGGGSSGGQLAAALGVSIGEVFARDSPNRSVRPSALVLYNPMLDLSPGRPDHHLVQDYWREISPFHNVDGSVPPTLILLGTQDVELPVSSAESFCKIIKGAGGHCEIALYENQRHGFFNYQEGNPEYFNKTNARIMQFLGSLWN